MDDKALLQIIDTHAKAISAINEALRALTAAVNLLAAERLKEKKEPSLFDRVFGLWARQ